MLDSTFLLIFYFVLLQECNYVNVKYDKIGCSKKYIYDKIGVWMKAVMVKTHTLIYIHLKILRCKLASVYLLIEPKNIFSLFDGENILTYCQVNTWKSKLTCLINFYCVFNKHYFDECKLL